MPLKTPDVTLAQAAAVLTFVVAQAVAWGWLTSERGQLVVSIGGTVLAAAWKIADAIIRNGRSKGALVAAAAAPSATQAVGVPTDPAPAAPA